jgi:hypothetical protein
MTLLLLINWKSVGAAQRPATRGRPEWLPGLAAAAKKQHAHHDGISVADDGLAGRPHPPIS